MSAIRLDVTARGHAWPVYGALLGVVMAAILLLFAGDAAKIVTIWWTSSTFGHCLFLPPILAFLVWQRRAELARLSPMPWLPGLAAVAAGGLGWLIGEAASVAVARHAGLVLMLDGAVVTLLGLAVARALAFPLGYAFFMVPAGEGLVPPLQTITAKMCMALLALAHVPAKIDGVFITTQAGWFEVADACSGVKFLIAMVALGVLAAHLCFRSWLRRAGFLLVCIVVPVLANGMRAFMTIYVASFEGAQRATGFDHVVYGWFFFAAVIAAILGLSWPFFDRRIDDTGIDPAALQRPGTPPGERMRLIGAAALVLLLAAAPVAWSGFASAQARPLGHSIALPAVPGWHRVRIAGAPWQPRFVGADHFLIGRYADAHGRSVDVAVAVYDSQGEGHEIVGYGQGAIDPDGGWAWTADTAPPPGGRAFRIAGPAEVAREVATFYRLSGRVTGSEVEVKLLTLKAHLLGGSQRAAALLVSAEPGEGGRPAIDAFLAAIPPVGAFLDGIATAG